MTNAILRGKLDAGNPHVRFDEGGVASAKPRRVPLLHGGGLCRANSQEAFLSVLICMFVSCAHAAFTIPTGAIEHTVKDANANESCFKSGAHWGDGTGGAPDDQHDYYSNGEGKQVVMNGTFPGRSLWLQGWACAKNGNGTAVNIEDLHLYNAGFVYYSFPAAFGGNITVHGGATSQFPLGASSASTFRLTASLKNDGDGAVFQIARDSDRGYVYSVPATGSWAEWNGEARIGADINFSLQNSGCPGAIFVKTGARFTAQPTEDMTIGVFSNMVDAVSVAFNVPVGRKITIGSFTGSSLATVTTSIAVDGQSNGLFQVTRKFTPGPSPLKVVVSGALAMAQDTPYAAVKLPLVRFASGVFDEAKLSDFEITYSADPWSNYASLVTFNVETDSDGARTLYLKRNEIIVHTTEGGYPDTAENWTPNGAAINSNATYVVLRSTARPNNSLSFHDMSPVFEGGRLVYGLVQGQKYEYRIADLKSITVADLCLEGGVQLANYYFTDEPARVEMNINGGYMTLYPRNSKPVILYCYNSHLTKVESEIRGKGDLELKAQTEVASPIGFFELTGLNTNYAGKVRVTVDNCSTSGKGPAPTESNCTTVYVHDGRNLGGPMAVAAKDGITVRQMCVLETRESKVVFCEPTRGIKVEGLGRFRVRDGETLEIRSPLTYAGELRKEGLGTLSLSGAPYYEDGATQTPVIGSNKLTVQAGAVKPLTSDALKGVAISFADDAILAFDRNPEDMTLATQGVDLTSSGTDLKVGDSNRLLVRIDGEMSQNENFDVPLFTVSGEAEARTLARQIRVRKPMSGMAGLCRVEKNPGETYRVVANVASRGLMLVVR